MEQEGKKKKIEYYTTLHLSKYDKGTMGKCCALCLSIFLGRFSAFLGAGAGEAVQSTRRLLSSSSWLAWVGLLYGVRSDGIG